MAECLIPRQSSVGWDVDKNWDQDPTLFRVTRDPCDSEKRQKEIQV